MNTDLELKLWAFGGLIVIGAILLVGGLCRAAHNGDNLIRNELDREEMQAIARHTGRKSIRAILSRILS